MGNVGVVALSVTYNSSDNLKKAVTALLNQTVCVDKIVVADNNSNALHKEKLQEISRMASNIEIIWLQDNTGGAGGFHAAMKYAKEQYDPQWYWLMDDDAYPEPDCLEKLLKYKEQSSNIGILAPVIYGIDKNQYQLYHPRVKRGNSLLNTYYPISNDFSELKDVERIHVNAFVGPLVSAVAVQTCGLPRAELFIEGDDFDYTYRVSQKFDVFLIKEAKMNHRDIMINTELINENGWWKTYYVYRNLIMFSLNNLTGLSKYLTLAHTIGSAYKQKIKMHRDPRYKGYVAFKWNLMRKGMLDGFRRKGGCVLAPEEYRKILEEHKESLKGKK